MTYYSQSNQDKWVTEFYNNKKNGYFVEIGAYDGIQTSNTFFLEKNLNWSGLCIEANPFFYSKLKQNRMSVNVNIAVTDYKGFCNFTNDKITFDGKQIPCNTLNNIFNENQVPKIIDYLSIDIEGFEYIALKDFNFENYKIGLITVEHNLYLDGPERKNKIFELLVSKGFTRVFDNVLCLDTNPLWYNQPYEDWYINNHLITDKIN